MRLPRFIAVPGVRASQYFHGLFGFELVDRKPQKPPDPTIKDAEFYQPLLQPWLMPEWKRRLRVDDPRSLVSVQSRYVLYCLASDAARRCNGHIAECGVYKGGTAKILAELIPDRPIYLFDTFTGMPEVDPTLDRHKAGDFADTSIESVRAYLCEHKNVTCMPGLVPASLSAVADRAFSFVHVDLDIYTAIKSACEFFYPRVQPGGFMLFDDYGFPSCPGAREAVDEFFADKPEVKICLMTGQCSVQKLPL